MQPKTYDAIKKYGFEFLTIFIGLFAAFALDRWNENRKDQTTETKILVEIKNGLTQDFRDIDINIYGHNAGLEASRYFGKVLLNRPFKIDSLHFHYFNLLRDFISVQNISGYETLKSKGLEIIANDSLRTEILSLYENDYNTLRKLEEEYSELQFHATYHKDFDNLLGTNFIMDQNGRLNGINQPLRITEKEKTLLIIDLWKINSNRAFIISAYEEVKGKIEKLQ